MSLDSIYYEAAHAMLDRRRDENKLAEAARRSEVLRAVPEYGELECRLADNAAKIVPAIMEGGEVSEKIAQIRDESVAAGKRMKELLVRGGFPENYLDPIYTCPLCHDKGSLGGRWCGCFMKLVYAAASKALNEKSPMKLSRFEDFDLSLYPETPDPDLKQSQRAVMTDNFKVCAAYAEEFDGSGRGLFMIGNTGLGKTHLSLAAANRIIERGYSVIYGSVPELLRTLGDEQFRRSSGSTMPLLTGCDLLILDDLGAENATEHAVSQLYEIINARLNRNIPLIVNTNFTAQQIKARYQDRIWSRLFSLKVLMFCGTDNRLKLSRQ